jgi:hypothetical protein
MLHPSLDRHDVRRQNVSSNGLARDVVRGRLFAVAPRATSSRWHFEQRWKVLLLGRQLVLQSQVLSKETTGCPPSSLRELILNSIKKTYQQSDCWTQYKTAVS